MRSLGIRELLDELQDPPLQEILPSGVPVAVVQDIEKLENPARE